MLPDQQKLHPKHRGHPKTNLNHNHRHKSVSDDYIKDYSFIRSDNQQDRRKPFLPGIGNFHQPESYKSNQNKHQRKNSHMHNRSAIDQYPTGDEKNPHSQNHSADRPAEKKFFDDNNSYEYGYPEDAALIGYDDQSYTSPPAGKTLNSPQQKHYNNANPDSFQRVIAGINAQPNRETKKAYGQYLLDQIKANENKKNLEKLQRQQEDREMLNQPNFLDGFGKSRDKFLKKYRSKMLDSPEPAHDNNKQMPPVTFDKIHNHNRNYNLYHPPLHEEVDQSLRKTSVPPLRITKHHTEDKQSPINTHAVNQTIQPHYNHELLYPSEELETNVIESDRGQSYEEESGKSRSKLNKIQNKNASHMKPSNSQKLKTHLKRNHTKPSEGGLSWKPSTDKLVSEHENFKNHLLKLEYQKVLEQQALEKHLHKEYENKVREMEDMLEDLRHSRERLLQELETNVLTPKTKSTPRMHQHSYSQTPRGKTTSNSNPKNLSKNRQNHHRPHQNSQRGGDSGAPIVLQPGDFSSKKNKTLPKNNSSKRTLSDNKSNSRHNLHERADSDRHLTFPSHQDESPKTEIRLLRDELRENYKNFQDQLADVKNFIQKPVDYLKPKHKGYPNIKESESKRSLANETKFVPIHNTHNHPMNPERLLPYNYYNKPHILKSPDSYNEKYFPSSPIIQEEEILGAPEFENEKRNKISERDSMDKLKNLASMIESSVKDQNLELRKEIKDLKDQIAKLMEGKGNQTDYNSIHKRLTQIKDGREDSQPVQKSNFQLTYSTKKPNDEREREYDHDREHDRDRKHDRNHDHDHNREHDRNHGHDHNREHDRNHGHDHNREHNRNHDHDHNREHNRNHDYNHSPGHNRDHKHQHDRDYHRERDHDPPKKPSNNHDYDHDLPKKSSNDHNHNQNLPKKSSPSTHHRVDDPRISNISAIANLIDYKKFYPKIIQDRSLEPRSSELKANGSRPSVPNKSDFPAKNILHHYAEMQRVKDVDTHFSKHLHLKKRTRGVKRRIRTGEEEKSRR